MRKFLWVVGAGTLVLALAAPAMALDFKYGGEFRVRFYSYVNGSGGANLFTDVAGSNPRGAQLRVRPLFTVSDDNNNIQAVLRLEIGDIEFGNGGGASSQANGPGLSPGSARTGNGSGGSFGADGVNVETKWAYLDAAFPFGIPLRARAGIQPWFLPKGIIMDDDVAGLRLYGTSKPVSYELSWFRVSGGANTNTGVCPPSAANTGVQCNTSTANTTDNNHDFYQFRIDAAIAPFFNPGIYYLYGRNAGTAAGTVLDNNHYFGFTATGKVGIVSYDLDFVYGTAEGGPDGLSCLSAAGATVACTAAGATPRDVAGFALDAAVHVPIGPVTLNLAGSIATGDDRTGGDSDAFPSIAASWNGPGGLFHIIGSGGAFDVIDVTQDAPTNLWAVGLTADYRPVKQLLTTAGVAFAGFTSSRGNCSVGVAGIGAPCYGPAYPKAVGSPYLGTEIFLRADYDVWTGFKVQSMVGWLVPTQGKTAAEYILQLLYNF